MKSVLKSLVTIVFVGLWINASEFYRNEVLLKSIWVAHFERLGLNVPNAPINAALWMVWGLIFAALIYVLSTRFNGWATAVLAWCFGFVLMWLVMFNLLVLPLGIAAYAVVLSMLEVAVATWLCRIMQRP